MTTTLNAMTVEDLGQDATDQDLEQFKGYVRALMATDSAYTEREAIAAIWNDGDYLAGAEKYGVS